VRKDIVLSKMEVADKDISYVRTVSYADQAETSRDATKYGTTFWSNKEIEKLLEAYGLPKDLPLSVLCVEVFTNITNEQDYRTRNIRTEEILKMEVDAAGNPGNSTGDFNRRLSREKPLSNNLGNFRILRTSPLVEVPFVCCTE
jgi:hypothetical protein